MSVTHSSYSSKLIDEARKTVARGLLEIISSLGFLEIEKSFT